MVLCSLQTLSSSQLFLTVSRELAFNFLSLKHLHNESSEASVTSTSASFQTESTEDQKKFRKVKHLMYSLLLFWFVMRGKLYWILSFVL